jgi:hypothetical protein
MMADPLLAPSAVDRLVSTAHELVIEGESLPATPETLTRNTGVSVDPNTGDHHA